MNLQFWALIGYLAVLIFQPQDMWEWLVPFRLTLVFHVFAMIVAILRAMKGGEFNIPKSKQNIILVILLIIAFISQINAVNLEQRNKILSILFKCVSLYFVIILTIDSEVLLKKFIWILIIFMTTDSFISAYQFSLGNLGYRMRSYFGEMMSDSNEFAMVMVMMLPLAYLIIRSAESRLKKGFLLLLMRPKPIHGIA